MYFKTGARYQVVFWISDTRYRFGFNMLPSIGWYRMPELIPKCREPPIPIPTLQYMKIFLYKLMEKTAKIFVSHANFNQNFFITKRLRHEKEFSVGKEILPLSSDQKVFWLYGYRYFYFDTLVHFLTSQIIEHFTTLVLFSNTNVRNFRKSKKTKRNREMLH